MRPPLLSVEGWQIDILLVSCEKSNTDIDSEYFISTENRISHDILEVNETYTSKHGKHVFIFIVVAFSEPGEFDRARSVFCICKYIAYVL